MKRVVLVVVLLAAAVGAWLWRNRSPVPAGPVTTSRPNVLLVTIDTLRADRVGHGLTPSIDRLAARAVTFSSVRATAPLTLPSHVSMMTGVLPAAHGVRENGAVFDRKTPTLARIFKDAGYRTGAFVGAYVLNRRFGLDEGFETYDDAVRRDPERAEQLEAERPGAAVVDAALQWLPGGPLPFFLWVHLYDPHAPYVPPAEFLRNANGNAYDGEVAYADAQVGRLLDALDARGLGSSTIVVVTGDHGESLGEHGEATHGMLAYDATLRVPLVVAVPGRARQQESTPRSLADLSPMLLEYAGLRPAANGAPVYSETRYPRRAGWHALTSLADDRWKLIRSSEVELYEITTDPSERSNVADTHPNVVGAMAAALERIQGGRDVTTPISADASERLRALGYVSGAAPSTSDDPRAPNPARVIAAWTAFEEALGQMRSGRAAEAAVVLARLASAHPSAPVFQTTYAQALKDAGNPRAAVDVYKAAVTKWPGDATLFHDLAVAAREAGNLDEASRAEQAALALDGTSAMALNGLGLLHADAGRGAEAAAAFERAAQHDPTNASYWTNMGNARRSLGDVPGAVQAYNRALGMDAQFADALNGLGVVEVQSGRAAAAVALFERALRRDPQLHEARLNLGIALQESGQPARAAEVYRQVLATAPASAVRERQAAAELLGRRK